MSEGFLARWARRKAEAQAASPPRAVPSPAPPPAEQQPPAPLPQGCGERQADAPPDLPPIDSLGRESDFSPFLKDGIPEDLRRAALSRLWASDPLFSRPEIHDLHMEDYSQPLAPDLVRTAWRFGRGMLENHDACANFPASPEETTKEAPENTSPPTET